VSGPYDGACKDSILRPEACWGAAAVPIAWKRPWDTVLDGSAPSVPGGPPTFECASVVRRLPKNSSGTIMRNTIGSAAAGAPSAALRPDQQLTGVPTGRLRR
jgi:hypothetical protein